MSVLIPFVPLAAVILFSWWFWGVNKRRGWFTAGELLFWDVIVLVIFQLAWLIWF